MREYRYIYNHVDTVTNIPHGGLAQMEGRGLLGGGDGRGDNYNYTQSLTPNNHDQVIFVDAAACQNSCFNTRK